MVNESHRNLFKLFRNCKSDFKSISAILRLRRI